MVNGGRKFGSPGTARTSPPPRERDVEGAWPALEVYSRCPDESVRFGARADLMWDGLWGASSQATWMSRLSLDNGIAEGRQKLPSRYRRWRDDPVEAMFSSPRFADRAALLAAVDMWRTLTAEQARAVTGCELVTDPYASVAGIPMMAGLVDIGALVQPSPLVNRRFTPETTVYRPGRLSAKVFEEQVAPRLSWPEWLSMTAGRPWGDGGTYDRHNTIGAELALRWLECTDVAAVLGEKLSGVELLAGEGIGRRLAEPDGRSADALLVRRDGSRVAIEVTQSTESRFFGQKVERWASLLAEAPYRDSGLSVLFVIAPPVERRNGTMMEKSWYAAASKVLQAVRKFPGLPGSRTRDRMAVAAWERWFPASRMVHPSFFVGEVWTPPAAAGGVWSRREWLGDGVLEFEPRRPELFSALIEHAKGFAGVPWWARDREGAPRWWEYLLAERGHVGVPVPPRDRPDRGPRTVFSAYAADSVEPMVPPRMLGVA